MRTRKWILTASLVVASGIWAGACGDDPIRPPPPPAHEHTTASVTLNQTSLTLKSGEEVTLSAVAKCACGSVLPRTITWTSSDPLVASVSSSGVVTAVTFGTATIIASVDGLTATASAVIEPLGTVVDAAGATVVSADGNVILEIPAGALDGPTDVVITKVDVTTLSARAAAGMSGAGLATLQAALAALQMTPAYVNGTGYDIQPEGLKPKKPTGLTIKYDPGNVPEGYDPQLLRIQHRDRVQNRWEECEHDGMQDNALQAHTETFGTFAVFAMPTPEPAVVNVSPATLDLETGDVVQLSAEVLDQFGNVIDAEVTWSVSDPTIATVDDSGTLTAIAEGSTSVTAKAGSASSQAAGVSVKRKVTSVVVTPATATIFPGGSVQLAAEARDADGNVVDRHVTWSSSAAGIASVSQTGLVSAVALGTATITAQVAQGVSGSATVTVSPPVTSIVISGNKSSPLQVGTTRQLTAVAYTATQEQVVVTFSWTSSDETVASVSQAGLVTALKPGTVNISAAVGSASASVSVRVIGEGEEEETGGNNMSWPVVFSNGVGLTGLAVASDPGVRPLAAEGITVDVLPFWWSENVADYGTYYLQNSTNVWRAEYTDGTGQPKYDAEVKFGDNLFAKSWKVTSKIRVEVAMNATAVGTLKGFNMFLLEGEGASEIQGTDGTTADFVPLIYLPGPIITIERISGPDGSVLGTVFSGDPTVEMNGAGRIIWGYQLDLAAWTPPAGVTKDGMYRIRFRIPTDANATITSVYQGEAAAVASVVSPREAKIEFTIVP